MSSNPGNDKNFPVEPLVQVDDNDRAGGPFPPFGDPAHSPGPAVTERQTAPSSEQPPIDTQYAGHPQFSQDAASNTPPEGIGNSEPVDDVDEKTRHSEGQNRRYSTPNPSTEKVSGAGPAIAEHSKDAKAPKAGRPPSAYVKD